MAVLLPAGLPADPLSSHGHAMRLSCMYPTPPHTSQHLNNLSLLSCLSRPSQVLFTSKFGLIPGLEEAQSRGSPDTALARLLLLLDSLSYGPCHLRPPSGRNQSFLLCPALIQSLAPATALFTQPTNATGSAHLSGPFPACL